MRQLHKPGDMINVSIDGCWSCGVPDRMFIARVLAYMAEEDMYLIKIQDQKYYAIVMIDENLNIISQPCGDFNAINHLITHDEHS